MEIEIGQKYNRWTVLRWDGGLTPANRKKWVCQCECGTIREVIGDELKAGKSKSCGCLQKEKARKTLEPYNKNRLGSKNHTWKSGRLVDKKGYVKIWIDPALKHPRTLTGAKYVKYHVLEHVLVMEKHLGRYLTKEETIHHKNGVRGDNRIENLELWTKNHPTGQRVEDLIQFSLEILQKYAPDKLK